MTFITKIAVALGCVASLAGCGTSSLSWQNTKPIPYQTQLSADKANIVVYRTADSVNGAAVNIYVNGEYLASLQDNAYTQQELCPNSQRLYSQFTGLDPAYREKAQLGVFFDLPANQISFFQLVERQGRPTLEPVSEQEAKAALASMPKQVNTLPRVDAKPCELKTHYQLEASALFAFNSSQQILASGQQEIAQIARQSLTQAQGIKRVEVIGYSDPMGRETYNRKLSLARAEKVKQLLAQNGLNPANIDAIGRGAENLLVANCAQQYPQNRQKQQACNQPNRRVELVFYFEPQAK